MDSSELATENSLKIAESAIDQAETSSIKGNVNIEVITANESSITEAICNYRPAYRDLERKCFPKNRHGNRFLPVWFSEYDWLEYDPTVDRAFCYSCRILEPLKLPIKTNKSAFGTHGFGSWRYAIAQFERHQTTLAHKISHSTVQAAKKGKSFRELFRVVIAQTECPSCHLCYNRIMRHIVLRTTPCPNMTCPRCQRTNCQCPFECPKCKCVMKGVLLAEHLRHLCPKIHRNMCAHCGRQIPENLLKAHQIVCKEAADKSLKGNPVSEYCTRQFFISCRRCGQEFPEQRMMNVHALECSSDTSLHDSKSISSNKIPNFEVSEFDSFERVETFVKSEEEAPTTNYACNMCKERFSTPADMHKHLVVYHKNGQTNMKCTQCDKQFQTAFKLRSHVREHVRQRKLKQSSSAAHKKPKNIPNSVQPCISASPPVSIKEEPESDWDHKRIKIEPQ